MRCASDAESGAVYCEPDTEISVYKRVRACSCIWTSGNEQNRENALRFRYATTPPANPCAEILRPRCTLLTCAPAHEDEREHESPAALAQGGEGTDNLVRESGGRDGITSAGYPDCGKETPRASEWFYTGRCMGRVWDKRNERELTIARIPEYNHLVLDAPDIAAITLPASPSFHRVHYVHSSRPSLFPSGCLQ